MNSPVISISPSMFYYWNECPLRAVFYYKYKDEQFFPRHPDIDLGHIIHSFFEKKNEWELDSVEAFSEKWEQQIEQINKDYQKNSLQINYFPVQWHANFYAIKKELLKRQIVKKKRKSYPLQKRANHEVQIKDDKKVIEGKADLIIYDNDGLIIELIDFKTGSIYKKEDGQLKIKDEYIAQLALYAEVIKDKQGFKPTLSLIDIQGNKHIVDISDDCIEEIYQKAQQLKNTINTSWASNDHESLANVSEENCYMCNYRKVCKSYKENFINVPIKKSIDICGELKSIYTKSVTVLLPSGIEFKVMNLKKEGLIENKQVCIYNLYYPGKESNPGILYAQKNTVVDRL